MPIVRALAAVFLFSFFSDALLAGVDSRTENQPDAGGLSGKKTEKLTMSQAIEMALRNNLDVRWNRVDVKADADRIRLAWGAFDPALTLSATRESIRTPQNAEQIVATGEGENLLQLEQVRLNQEILFEQQVILARITGQPIPTQPASFSSPLASTITETPIFEEENAHYQTALQGKSPWGTQYTFGLRADRLDNTLNRQIPPSLFNPEWSTFVGGSVTQPLLRDFGFDANLADVRIARKNKEITQLTWESKIVTALQTVMTTYYDMLYGLESIKENQAAIGADNESVRENQRRMELGMMTPIDVRQAEVAVSTDKESLIAATNFFMERQFQLKRELLSEMKSDDDRVFMPIGRLQVEAPRLDRTELIRLAFDNRLDYRNALKDADIQNIRLRFAKNQLWPRLDLIATFGFNGLSRTFDSSWSNTFDSQAPQWSVGVQASIPLGNLQARAQYDVVKGLKEQAILRIKQVELNISLDVDTMISRIQSNVQSLDTSRKSRGLAEDAVKIQQRRIEEGQISNFEALETRKKLYQARGRELAAMADLNKSIVQLWVATGTLLEKLSITVER